MNSKRHLVCDQNGRPLQMLLSDGNLNNIVGASLTFDTILLAKVLIVDKGHDFDYFREALEKFG
jgi:transposase